MWYFIHFLPAQDHDQNQHSYGNILDEHPGVWFETKKIAWT